MDVKYASQRLADACSSERQLNRKYGTVRAKRLTARLRQLELAETLADLMQVAPRTHPLTGEYAGAYAIDLDGPYRLIFEPLPDEDPPDPPPSDTPTGTRTDTPGQHEPTDPGAAFDPAFVTAVVVTDIVDYH